MNIINSRNLFSLAGIVAGVAGMAFEMKAQESDFISPVTNPLFFEDANIATEIRPVFAQHSIPKSFITGGGDARLYAVEFGAAVLAAGGPMAYSVGAPA